ncbi:MAG TPA: cyanoexosortase B system-associated protein [Chroococcidiopsis sp.]
MAFLALSPQRSHTIKALIVVFVLAIAAVSAVPNYITGQWFWKNPPEIAALSALRDLQKSGLELPGWTTADQSVGEIGGHKWSVQTLQRSTPDSAPASSPTSSLTGSADAPPAVILLLRPQTFYKDQPQVDWMDVKGAQHWTADHLRSVQFKGSLTGSLAGAPSDSPEVTVKARYLRGWNQKQTYAVVQWYAWATGGSPSTGDWFWADQWEQLSDRQRMPWIAVSLLIPIKPLGDIESSQEFALSLSQTIQSELMTHYLALTPA